jgi:adenosylmethionine-8-amino-7-oxononanoate aminotransferase
VHDTIAAGGFTHGFTNSHHPVGAAAGLAVLGVLRERGLVHAAERQGARLDAALRAELAGHPAVGDIRGIGMLRAV